jgi:hypothetical protein
VSGKGKSGCVFELKDAAKDLLTPGGRPRFLGWFNRSDLDKSSRKKLFSSTELIFLVWVSSPVELEPLIEVPSGAESKTLTALNVVKS